MIKNREKITLIIGSLFVYICIETFLYLDKKRKEELYLEEKVQQLGAEFFVTLEKFEKLSEFFTYSKLRNDDITNILNRADPKCRYTLLDKIYTDFRILKSNGYSDVIFLLPDGTLFLDTNNPNKVGIKMVDIDNVIVVSNTLKNSVDKRFYDSMVYSYPLFYKDRLVAYVYFTVPFYTVGKDISNIFKNAYVFYIKKDYISLYGKRGYIQSELGEDYYVDRKFYNLKIKTKEEDTQTISQINQKIRWSMGERIKGEDSFSVPVMFNDDIFIISFLSIKDLSGKHIGYLTSYKKDDTFTEFKNSFLISSILIGIIVLLTSILIHHILRMKSLAEKNAITDKLTNVFNRMAIEPILKIETERAKRSGKPISLIIFDIDFFKKINDRYGHNAGDYVLKKISEIIKNNIRKADYIVRWGGEEFLLLLPETDIDGAKKLAEKLRAVVENFSFKDIGNVTISLGVTQMKTGENLDQAIKRADEALYMAKNKGRNRVESNYY